MALALDGARRGELEIAGSTNRAARSGHSGRRLQAPAEEAPVVTSLTEAERAELARRAAEANKRSADNARMQGRR
ncbi:hypothetical protein SSP531S_56490 [Streptomyces spongiicola]|uniref:Uncharacterized protein n=1 Tax=Streptomyces spongiicola TaxID=1690221 RepID=A0A388T5D7_9ACTN|nr:hypothetical protein SSP531S_56490 [Streptomyces spongiicola]